MKILLTGSTGFLGRHARAVLESNYGAQSVFCPKSSDYDLMQLNQVERLFEEFRPDVVVHLAGYVGGIGANKEFPADFYFRNTILTANVFHIAAKTGVKKIIYPIGGCSYPANAISPIDESQFWCGYPQEESAPYSTSKMMGIVAAKSYQKQHGLNATVIVPGNMYGPFDNYNNFSSHVIPAMIRRFYEAKSKGDQEIVMWGSGAPVRDFVYAPDVAKLIPFFIDSFSEIGPINISSGTSISIKDLALMIKKIIKFEGQIKWDVSKPDGQMKKIFSVKKLNDLKLNCPTKIEDGLRLTINWFEDQYQNNSTILRL
jgi:GDP-L-fucose synthase